LGHFDQCGLNTREEKREKQKEELVDKRVSEFVEYREVEREHETEGLQHRQMTIKLYETMQLDDIIPG